MLVHWIGWRATENHSCPHQMYGFPAKFPMAPSHSHSELANKHVVIGQSAIYKWPIFHNYVSLPQSSYGFWSIPQINWWLLKIGDLQNHRFWLGVPHSRKPSIHNLRFCCWRTILDQPLCIRICIYIYIIVYIYMHKHGCVYVYIYIYIHIHGHNYRHSA